MRLFDNANSPYALKVRIALYEKGLEFEKHELRFQRDREELLRVNPRGEVPALEDGGTVVYDSRIICEYLEDRYPTPPLVPADPAARARCRTLEAVADTQIDPCMVVIALAKMFRPEVGTSHPEALQAAADALDKHYANLERELGDRAYLVGDFSRADVALAPHLFFAAFMGYGVPERYPRLAAWMGRVGERPSVKRASTEALETFTRSQEETGEAPLFDSQHLHWRGERIEWLVRVGLGPWLLEEIAAGRAFFSPVP
jgi:glutathione S-transferase